MKTRKATYRKCTITAQTGTTELSDRFTFARSTAVARRLQQILSLIPATQGADIIIEIEKPK